MRQPQPAFPKYLTVLSRLVQRFCLGFVCTPTGKDNPERATEGAVNRPTVSVAVNV